MQQYVYEYEYEQDNEEERGSSIAEENNDELDAEERKVSCYWQFFGVDDQRGDDDNDDDDDDDDNDDDDVPYVDAGSSCSRRRCRGSWLVRSRAIEGLVARR